MIDLAAIFLSLLFTSACPECAEAHARALNDDVAATAPSANGNSAPSAPVMATRWGAVATGDGAMGVAEMFESREQAERKAMRDCQDSAPGAACTVRMSYYNQCVAVSWGDDGSRISRGPDLAEVEADAFATCRSNSTNCELMYSSCSYPERVG